MVETRRTRQKARKQMTQKPSIVMLDESAIGYVRTQLSEASGDLTP